MKHFSAGYFTNFLAEVTNSSMNAWLPKPEQMELMVERILDRETYVQEARMKQSRDNRLKVKGGPQDAHRAWREHPDQKIEE